jgi:flagellar protein FlaG
MIMSIEAINTARLQNSLPANAIAGNTAVHSPVTEGDKAREQQKQTPKSNNRPAALVKALNEDMEAIRSVGLQFSVNQKTGKTVVRVVDKDTGELIRQIPPQDMLDLANKLEDMMGILFDKQV